MHNPHVGTCTETPACRPRRTVVVRIPQRFGPRVPTQEDVIWVCASLRLCRHSECSENAWEGGGGGAQGLGIKLFAFGRGGGVSLISLAAYLVCPPRPSLRWGCQCSVRVLPMYMATEGSVDTHRSKWGVSVAYGQGD